LPSCRAGPTAPAINYNAFDAVPLLPIGLAAGSFRMLGRRYGAQG
jgi:hypothetical protein